MKLVTSLVVLGVVVIISTITDSVSVSKRIGGRATRDDLIGYLSRISGSYTLSGQHNREPNSDPTKWTRVARDITGLYPGLWGGDFLFLPDDVQHRQSMVDEAIRQWNSGSVVALTWHVCPPTVGETCNWDNQGILSSLNDDQWKEILSDGANLNQKWKARLDTIVPYLKQLESAGVVALFRPVHEINEGWSWWGGKSGQSKQLYQITHDYLTNYHNLRSLVWVWCVKDVQMGSIGDYWPGSEYVDVASLDMWMKQYPTDDDYNKMVQIANGKPIALAEVGSVPTPDILTRQPRWAWFMVWAEYLKDPSFNTDDGVKNTYYMSKVFSQGDIDIGGGGEVPSDNLALNHPILASSQQNSSYAPSNAVDGNQNTRWSSDLNDEQWIYVNLGQQRSVRQVKLFWEAAYAKGYQIQTSIDSQSWTTVHEDYNGDGGVDIVTIASSTAQYVKVYVFERATAYGYSLFEIEVYS